MTDDDQARANHLVWLQSLTIDELRQRLADTDEYGERLLQIIEQKEDERANRGR